MPWHRSPSLSDCLHCPLCRRLFLLGLAKFGKGDWRSISRNFVISRTPTQVASHAQKYFIRLNSINKDKRRSSIHDITSVAGAAGDPASHPAGPITGQTSNVVPPGMAHPHAHSHAHTQGVGVPAQVVAAGPPAVASAAVMFASPAPPGAMPHSHMHPHHHPHHHPHPHPHPHHLISLPPAPGHPAAYCSPPPPPPHHLVRPGMTAHGVPMPPMGFVPAKWE